MANTKEKGLIATRPDFSVAIKYSDNAVKKNLIKFIPKGNKAFEISVPDLISMLAKHVNSDVLSPAIMQNNVIKMIRVMRNLTLIPNEDIKAGTTVNIPFNHMMPIEFAIAEEALGLTAIDENVKTVNAKEYAEAKLRVNEGVEKFAREQNEGLLRQLNKETKEVEETSDQNTP